MLVAQFVGVVSGWRHPRISILRSLIPSLALVLVSLFVWNQQRVYVDQQLQDELQGESDRLATQLGAEITAHLEAVRRFASFWSLLEEAPAPKSGSARPPFTTRTSATFSTSPISKPTVPSALSTHAMTATGRSSASMH